MTNAIRFRAVHATEPGPCHGGCKSYWTVDIEGIYSFLRNFPEEQQEAASRQLADYLNKLLGNVTWEAK